MKILHTSDWHLGQKLLFNDREKEHQLALDWLLETIQVQEIDVLLVAGDIFDIGNPPNYARQMYFNFLRSLLTASCRHVVITGGNHDSPSMLNAPAELLKALNIHIIGAATDAIEDELILLKNDKEEVEAVVAAVPFLRDRDLRTSLAGEQAKDRQARLQDGLSRHYSKLAALAKPYEKSNLPILAMGHLYAKGALASDRQDNIYVGNRENMEASQFPKTFDYIALGHIHRPQTVGEQAHIRYAGSLIPLSFSETKDDKSVYLLEFKGKSLQSLEAIPAPIFRRLKTIQGSLEEVQASLDRFGAKEDRLLTPWVEVIVEADDYIPQLDQLLRDYCAEMPLELVKIRILRPNHSLLATEVDPPDLDDLQVEEVFRQKCRSKGDLAEEKEESLVATFRELQEWMRETDRL